MHELFETSDSDASLVNKNEWDSRIGTIQKTVQSLPPFLNSLPAWTLKEALISSVSSRLTFLKEETCGLLLSGGVDSSLLALLLKKAGANFICYTVGIKGSSDLEWSKKLAKSLGLVHKTKTLSLPEIESLLHRLSRLFEGKVLDENKAVLYGVACVELACLDIAKEDGIAAIFGGLGSEEIFAGYQRHENAAKEKVDKNGSENVNDAVDAINGECWRGLFTMYQRDLSRDSIIFAQANIRVLTPYLDEKVITEAMKIPGKEKIFGEHKKVVLRKIAQEVGLDKDFAWRKKKAAQYGSAIDKAIELIAKKNGFQKKGEYLASLEHK